MINQPFFSYSFFGYVCLNSLSSRCCVFVKWELSLNISSWSIFFNLCLQHCKIHTELCLLADAAFKLQGDLILQYLRYMPWLWGGNPVIIGDWVKQVATSYSSISLYSLLILIAVDQLAALLHMRRVWPLRTPRNSRTYQPAIKSVKYCIAGVKSFFFKHRHHSGWEICFTTLDVELNSTQLQYAD